jgi:hypothetical protein
MTNRRILLVLRALSIGALLTPLGATAATAATADPTTPVPVCAGAKDVVVDVTQDVRNQPLLLARDGHVWADFSYRQHLRIWSVGARQYCVRKDYSGTWTSIAGVSPGLTGTIGDGLNGTFDGSELWAYTGKLAPVAATSGHLGEVQADCTAADVCADDGFLIVDTLYFSQGWEHCMSLLGTMAVEAGEHGHLSLTLRRGTVTGTGDITG